MPWRVSKGRSTFSVRGHSQIIRGSERFLCCLMGVSPEPPDRGDLSLLAVHALKAIIQILPGGDWNHV